MRKLAVLLLGIMLIMMPAALHHPDISVQVTTQDGVIITCQPAEYGDMVQLQFTHSMFGGYVREQWVITPANQMQRTRFVTENAAAAEYYATDGTSYRAGDGFVVPGVPLQQSELVVRVNSRGNHVLTVGDSTIHLAGELPQSTQVRIAVVTASCDNEN